jgi:hypothetical protein
MAASISEKELGTSGMTKPPAKKKAKKTAAQSIESNAVVLDLDPDAWPKFEKLIKSAAKMGPKPHKK